VSPPRDQGIEIVGAGLAGSLLAVLLARRGYSVTLYDRRPDPRESRAESGRSINLALAARGIKALERAGVMERVKPLLITMRGRMVHEVSKPPALLPYGQRDDEVIYSVGRAALNVLLVEEADQHENVTLRFGHACLGIPPNTNMLRFRDLSHPAAAEPAPQAAGRLPHAAADQAARLCDYEVPLGATIATDGASSAIRQSLVAAGRIESREDLLDHDYKELTLPARADGRHAMEPNALHIWPRGGFMLIALPNTDGTFTATLFLARHGEHSFASLATPQAVKAFFEREFPDAVPLMPNLLQEFQQHPQSQLGTVHTSPWRIDGKVMLLGDAAHAIVPFHGQGMNAAFEDCTTFDELTDQHVTWDALFAELEQLRKPNAAAIAQMALENYIEMRDTVRDPKFARHKALALELERRFPDRFIPRYAMVMFHPEIPYAEALRRGAVQTEILERLDTAPELAARLIEERLTPIQR